MTQGNSETPVPVPAPLDGATSQHPPIALELTPATEVARDATRELEERLEAIEDIIDSEVGDTTLARARNIER